MKHRASPVSADNGLDLRLTLSQRVAFALLYALGWAGLFLVSSGFWFLPAGWQLVGLWLTPTRYWFWLLLGAWGGALLMSAFRGVLDNPSVWLPWHFLLATAVVLGLRRAWPGRSEDGVLPWLRLLAIGAVCALSVSVYVGLTGHEGPIWMQALWQAPLFALGDFLGILLLAPVLLAMASVSAPHWNWPWSARTLAVAGQPALGWLALQWLPTGLSPLSLLALGAAALLGVAYRDGWRAAALASLLLSIAVHATFGRDEGLALRPYELQLVVAMMALAALLLGAAADTLRQRMRQVEAEREEVRRVAARLSVAQENERDRIGRDLHDAIGQTLTAARNRLHLARREVIGTSATAYLDDLRDLLADTHGELRAVIDSLHATDLTRHGLALALREGSIAQMLRDAGIAFDCDIALDAALSDHDATAVYRICQEAATNVVNARRARHFGLRLREQESDGRSCRVELALSDDGGAIASGATPGRGLQNIRDRALSLRAEYRFDPQDGEPRHWLRWQAAIPAG
ncbi:MAG: histidine kinase [Lysobacteraceae bacterium]